MSDNFLKEVVKAKSIYSHFSPIKAEFCRNLSAKLRLSIYCKWESRNFTGSFKERGVLNALLQLKKTNGVITASAGNHALALSYYAKKMKVPCHIICPVHTPVAKTTRIEENGAKLVLFGQNFSEAYQLALEKSKSLKLTFVHPYNQPEVIAGQGTIGLELLDECSQVKSIVVPVGGGGLISGISVVIKNLAPHIKVIGVRSEWAESKHPHASVSIADGIAIKSVGELPMKFIDRYVDDIVTVSEEAIAKAITYFAELEKSLVEGAGAAGLAAVLEGKIKKTYFPAILIVCGSNIDISLLARLLVRRLREEARLVKFRVAVADVPGTLGQAASLIGSHGGQIIQTYHDRLDSPSPTTVGITFVVEVRDKKHSTRILKALQQHLGWAELL